MDKNHPYYVKLKLKNMFSQGLLDELKREDINDEYYNTVYDMLAKRKIGPKLLKGMNRRGATDYVQEF